MSIRAWVKSFFQKEGPEEDAQVREIEAKRAELKARQQALAEESEAMYQTATNLATATTQGLAPEEQEELRRMLAKANVGKAEQ